MPGVNQQIHDLTVAHETTVRFYEENLYRQIENLTDDHLERLERILARNPANVTQVVAQVHSALDREIERASSVVFTMLARELRGFVSNEVKFTDAMLRQSIGAVWRVMRPSIRDLALLVDNAPIRDGRLLSQHFQDIAAGERLRLDKAIALGVAAGETPRQIARTLTNTNILSVTQNQMRAIARTGVTELASLAADRTYAENADVLNGYQYVATLDARTTPICSALDGLTFPIDRASAPKPPQHWNCRSTTIPLVKAFEDIPDVPQFRQNVVLTGRQRAALNGAVPAGENYGQFLARQSYEFRLNYFNGDVAQLLEFDNGVLTVEKFINRGRRFAPLDVLQQADRRLFGTGGVSGP